MEVRKDFVDEDDYYDYLIETGSLVMTFEGDEFVYHVVPDKCEHFAPEFYDSHLKEINEALLECVDKGFLELDIDETLEPFYRITHQAEKYFKKEE